LHISRIVSELAGVLAKRKGTLSVKKNALPLLAESAADALAARLFLAFFRKFNLEYLTPTQFEFQGLQARLAYSFYRLRKSGCDSIPVEQLPKLLLLDPDQGWWKTFPKSFPPIGHPERSSFTTSSNRWFVGGWWKKSNPNRQHGRKPPQSEGPRFFRTSLPSISHDHRAKIDRFFVL
jgi:hypothetical protein